MLEKFKEILTNTLGEDIILQADHQCLTVPTERIAEVCMLLHTHEDCYFDMLSCLTGLDNGVEKSTMEIVYNLYSIPFEHSLMLKIVFPRNQANEPLPVVPTVSHIWRTADWHEREVFDLLGLASRTTQICDGFFCPKIGLGIHFVKTMKLRNIIMGFR